MNPIVADPRRDGGRDGFSLLDMLVALVLIGLIGGLLSGLVGQFGSIRRARADAAIAAELSAAVGYIGNVVERAMPLRLLEADGNQGPYFRGGERRMEFVAIQRRGTNMHGLRETAFLISDSGGEPALVQRSWLRRAHAETRHGSGLQIPIVVGIDRLRFTYLTSGTREPVWLDHWQAKDQLPLAVRVTLGSNRSGRYVESAASIILRLSEPAIDEGETED